MWKCMLVDSMKYPLLSRWYDSQISWESVSLAEQTPITKSSFFCQIVLEENLYKEKLNKFYITKLKLTNLYISKLLTS